MKKQTYSIQQAIEDTAEAIMNGFYDDAAAIRTYINDLLDSAEKDGMRVNYRYNQEKAIDKVKYLVQCYRNRSESS